MSAQPHLVQHCIGGSVSDTAEMSGVTFNKSSTAVKRIMKEIAELRANPPENFICHPLEVRSIFLRTVFSACMFPRSSDYVQLPRACVCVCVCVCV